jgi:hypothetical protein
LFNAEPAGRVAIVLENPHGNVDIRAAIHLTAGASVKTSVAPYNGVGGDNGVIMVNTSASTIFPAVLVGPGMAAKITFL